MAGCDYKLYKAWWYALAYGMGAMKRMQMMDRKRQVIKDVRWFCAGHGNVGIVKVETQFQGIKYFIGQCKGENEDTDKMWIADWGSSFPTEAGAILFGD